MPFLERLSSFIRLEALLGVAVVALLWQVFPEFFNQMLSLLDIRDWTRTVWFIANLLFVLVLLAVRFGPDLYRNWQEGQQQRAELIANSRKKQEIKERKKAIEHIRESRARRRY